VRKSPWLGVIPLSIGLFLVLVDVSILNIALPSISRDFNAKASDVQWILNAYTITLVVLLVLAGKIGDMVEGHRYFALGMALFTISIYAQNPGTLDLSSLFGHCRLLEGR